jgi:hypothetical protein
MEVTPFVPTSSQFIEFAKKGDVRKFQSYLTESGKKLRDVRDESGLQISLNFLMIKDMALYIGPHYM